MEYNKKNATTMAQALVVAGATLAAIGGLAMLAGWLGESSRQHDERMQNKLLSDAKVLINGNQQ